MTVPDHLAEACLPIRAGREELCLDYANTLCWRGSATPSEALHDLPDLLTWLGGSALWPQPEIDRAGAWAAAHPEHATADFQALNRALAEAPPRRRLVSRDDGYAWATEAGARSAPVLLAPVLWSAADLLARADRLPVRRCANDACLWLFVDRSKGGTRRWCDMAACGNRAKAQRHYRRSKPA
jgi:hypothetical protein